MGLNYQKLFIVSGRYIINKSSALIWSSIQADRVPWTVLYKFCITVPIIACKMTLLANFPVLMQILVFANRQKHKLWPMLLPHSNKKKPTKKAGERGRETFLEDFKYWVNLLLMLGCFHAFYSPFLLHCFVQLVWNALYFLCKQTKTLTAIYWFLVGMYW